MPAPETPDADSCLPGGPKSDIVNFTLAMDHLDGLMEKRIVARAVALSILHGYWPIRATLELLLPDRWVGEGRPGLSQAEQIVQKVRRNAQQDSIEVERASVRFSSAVNWPVIMVSLQARKAGEASVTPAIGGKARPIHVPVAGDGVVIIGEPALEFLMVKMENESTNMKRILPDDILVNLAARDPRFLPARAGAIASHLSSWSVPVALHDGHSLLGDVENDDLAHEARCTGHALDELARRSGALLKIDWDLICGDGIIRTACNALGLDPMYLDSLGVVVALLPRDNLALIDRPENTGEPGHGISIRVIGRVVGLQSDHPGGGIIIRNGPDSVGHGTHVRGTNSRVENNLEVDSERTIVLPEGFPTPLEGIIFDMDNTLVEAEFTFAGVKRILAARLAGAGVDQLDLSDMMNLIEKLSFLEIKYGVEAGKFVSILEEEEVARARTTYLMEGAGELLEAMNKLGMRMALVSRNCRGAVTASVSRTGIGHFFRAIISREDTEHPKPHPQPTLLALGLMGSRPDRTIVVGDFHYDITSGRDAGLWTVGLGCEADTRVENLSHLHRLLLSATRV